MSLANRFARLLFAVCLWGAAAPQMIASSPATQAPCIVEDMDTAMMPACVIQSRGAGLYIPRKYWMHPSFNRYGLAVFTIQSFGNVYINRNGRIVIRDVAWIDNGPDDFHHGVVRINRDGKWGFADPSGRMVVPAKYSCATNFRDQFQDYGPLVCVGCRMERRGEYESCLGGQWFHADSHGQLTPAHGP